MRVAINCRSFLKQNYAGIGRYAFNLVKSLSEIDTQNEYWLYCQKKYFDFKRRTPRVAAKNFHVKVDWLGRGINKVLTPIDIYHSPSPDTLNITNAKIVATVHDLVYKTYPQGHTQATIETTERYMNEIVEKANEIICCSKSTMNDLKRNFDVDNKRVHLVYQGVDKDIFSPVPDEERKLAEAVLKKKGIEGPFILFVGTIEPRKNLQNLILAFSELKNKKKFSGKLVVVGMKGWMLEGLDQVIKNFYLSDEVIFPGFVTDQELRYFYNCAEIFVFPSFYEGFGFPIVEAFSCGAAVITSNVSSCPEIAADGAVTIDPYNPEELEAEILNVLEDQDRREALRKKALKRAQDFSFENTAQQTMEVYQEAYES